MGVGTGNNGVNPENLLRHEELDVNVDRIA
jgi:hypothetical protein